MAMLAQVSLIVGILASVAAADAPNDMNLQGRLVDGEGQPLAGPVNLTVRLYDAAAGGNLVYQEDHPAASLDNGVFELVIGTGSAPVGSFDADTFAGADRFLELLVNGSALEPRQPFRSVPYAFQVAQKNLQCSNVTNTASVQIGETFTLHAVCPAGTALTGGGFEFPVVQDDPQILSILIRESSAGQLPNAWTIVGASIADLTQVVTVWGRCCRLQ